VRSAALRKSAFILAKAFSMGWKLGLYADYGSLGSIG
jgi:hypothetical protein